MKKDLKEWPEYKKNEIEVFKVKFKSSVVACTYNLSQEVGSRLKVSTQG